MPCSRCGDTGSIATWCGRRGEGGKIGPCPRCQPEDVVKRFVTSIGANPFWRTPTQRFERTFTRDLKKEIEDNGN